jgi:hypothetical protein
MDVINQLDFPLIYLQTKCLLRVGASHIRGIKLFESRERVTAPLGLKVCGCTAPTPAEYGNSALQ